MQCHLLLTPFFTRNDQSKYFYFEKELIMLSFYSPPPKPQLKRELRLCIPCFPTYLSVLLEQLIFNWNNIKMPSLEFKDKPAGGKNQTQHKNRPSVAPGRSKAQFFIHWIQHVTSSYNIKMCYTMLFLVLRFVMFLSPVCTDRQQQKPAGHWLFRCLSTSKAMSSSMLPGV